MSPEIYKHEPYNQSADVYSFGILVYEVRPVACLILMWILMVFGLSLFLLHTSSFCAPSRSNLYNSHSPSLNSIRLKHTPCTSSSLNAQVMTRTMLILTHLGANLPGLKGVQTAGECCGLFVLFHRRL